VSDAAALGTAGAPLRRVVVGISGASGIVYGMRLLQRLGELDGVETHSVISPSARRTADYELDLGPTELESLADVHHRYQDLAASISSGSFKTDGMVVAPCSIKTLSSIANCFSDNLLSRAADVTLKERKPLVLLVRETPLHVGHLRLMLQAAEMGAVLMPPLPAFYNRPTSLDEMVDYSVTRALDQLGLDLPDTRRWEGSRPPAGRDRTRASASPVPD
jgi:4-hydroxy-3-polyprenylbenzoate decarboxylase